LKWLNEEPSNFPLDQVIKSWFSRDVSYPTSFEDPTMPKNIRDRLNTGPYGWEDEEYGTIEINRVDWYEQEAMHAPFYNDDPDNNTGCASVLGFSDWRQEMKKKFNIIEELEIIGY